jgi:hypothetical protein
MTEQRCRPETDYGSEKQTICRPNDIRKAVRRWTLDLNTKLS